MTYAGPSTKIMSFDPGGTTGWCKHMFRERATHDGEARWDGGQIVGDNHHRVLWKLLTAENPDVIVYEAFNYQIRQSQAATMPGVVLISREYIGVLQLYAQLRKIPIFKQQPSVITITWLKDDALEKMGQHNSGEPHRNDATRHMLYHLVQTLERTDYLSALRH
jgi:hypothetical protein